ncbi:MAG: ABC transporter ATP-binding protein [Bryobacterales bacterium]|nr:ABC transporter ATP-binding protein [Bryobacterales bacterium]
MAPSVELSGVEFQYRGGLAVLRIEHLRILPGEHCFLHGPSGSGKSTLRSIIAGVVTPQRGQVAVLGRQLTTLSQHGRDELRGAQMGYIFQIFNLIPYLTARENIELPMRLHQARARRLNGVSIEDAASELASSLAIGNLLDRKASDLSVGQQQRVAAARALIGSPPLLVADEPTSALDAEHRGTFVDLLFTQARSAGTTVLFVSHDLSLAARFDRCVRLAEINKAASM